MRDECPACHGQGAEVIYGVFHGGDPRNFSPDFECSSPEERAAHAAACKAADLGEGGVPADRCQPDESGVLRVGRLSFGLGVNTHPCDACKGTGKAGAR